MHAVCKTCVYPQVPSPHQVLGIKEKFPALRKKKKLTKAEQEFYALYEALWVQWQGPGFDIAVQSNKPWVHRKCTSLISMLKACEIAYSIQPCSVFIL